MKKKQRPVVPVMSRNVKKTTINSESRPESPTLRSRSPSPSLRSPERALTANENTKYVFSLFLFIVKVYNIEANIQSHNLCWFYSLQFLKNVSYSRNVYVGLKTFVASCYCISIIKLFWYRNQEMVLLLCGIKHQVRQNTLLLKQLVKGGTVPTLSSGDLAEFGIPLETMQDVEWAEELLKQSEKRSVLVCINVLLIALFNLLNSELPI